MNSGERPGKHQRVWAEEVAISTPVTELPNLPAFPTIISDEDKGAKGGKGIKGKGKMGNKGKGRVKAGEQRGVRKRWGPMEWRGRERSMEWEWRGMESKR